MTNPPPPGNWGPPQPPYGQGQPPYGSGPWPPQQGWGPPPQPPKNNSLKWLLIGVAVLLVIAISVGATLLFTRDGGGGTTQTANGNPPAAGEIASANDTGPVSIITEDPTCDPWRPIATTLASIENSGWTNRDSSIPATQWSPEMASQYESVAEAMRQAADQTVPLINMTPNRAMRELYEQSVIYWRAYAESVATYSPSDNHLANVAGNSSGAIVSICNAIDSRAAASRSRTASPAPNPQFQSEPSSLDAAGMVVTEGEYDLCSGWVDATDEFDADTASWREVDPNLPRGQWTPAQEQTMDNAAERMETFAQELSEFGTQSNNSTWDDIAQLSAQYWRSYSGSIPTYTRADHDLSLAAAYLAYVPFQACLAAEN